MGFSTQWNGTNFDCLGKIQTKNRTLSLHAYLLCFQWFLVGLKKGPPKSSGIYWQHIVLCLGSKKFKLCFHQWKMFLSPLWPEIHAKLNYLARSVWIPHLIALRVVTVTCQNLAGKVARKLAERFVPFISTYNSLFIRFSSSATRSRSYKPVSSNAFMRQWILFRRRQHLYNILLRWSLTEIITSSRRREWIQEKS